MIQLPLDWDVDDADPMCYSDDIIESIVADLQEKYRVSTLESVCDTASGLDWEDAIQFFISEKEFLKFKILFPNFSTEIPKRVFDEFWSVF